MNPNKPENAKNNGDFTSIKSLYSFPPLKRTSPPLKYIAKSPVGG